METPKSSDQPVTRSRTLDAALIEPAGPGETRAARRARLEEQAASGTSGVVARRMPMLAVATVLASGLLLLAAHADPVIFAAAYAWCVLVLAWAWPTALGAKPGWPIAIPTAAAGLLIALGFGLADNAPYLATAPVALAAATVLACLLQILRRDGRGGLTASLAASGLGLGVAAMGASYLPVLHVDGGLAVLDAAFAGLAVSVVADLLVDRERLRPWLMPLAMVLGGWAGAVVAALATQPAITVGLLLGLLSAGVAHGIRRVGAALPALAAWQAQLGVACASVLGPGVIVYVIGQVFIR